MRISKIMLVGCFWGGLAWGAGDAQIRIRVQDYSDLSAELRTKAQSVATIILGSAGVEPVWMECSPSLGEQMDEGCRTKPGPADLVLRLIPPRMARSLSFSTVSMGYALIPEADL